MKVLSARSLQGWLFGVGRLITLQKPFHRRKSWVLNDIGIDLEDVAKTIVYLKHPEKELIEGINLIDFVTNHSPRLLPEDQYTDVNP